MNGVSKAFAMTGWRIGLVCGPSQLISKINKVHAFTIMSATTCAQYAASEAFKNG
ncbi:MAG: aminotransferase class I/II-fold pyridoxal phosphate-dependent enzyme [Acetilactobacillus jinshanensis]